MNTTTNKIIIGAVLIVAIGGYVYWSSSQSSTPAAVATTPTATETDTTVTSTTTSTSGSSSGSTTASGSYKDGTYTGAVANSVYGNVQVSATISDGKLTDVTFLQAPSEQGHSAQLTASSEPVLKSEAIAAQSASVDIVSGATQTSEAFEQSLASALSQAQA